MVTRKKDWLMLFPEVEKRVAGFDGEVVFGCVGEMMTPAHDLADFVDRILNFRGRSGAGSDAQGVLLRTIFLEISGERKNDPVVERSAERCALFFADADDGAGDVVPANFLADGIHAGEKIIHQIGADDADGRGGVEVGIGDVAAFDQVHVVEFGHLRGPGAQVGVFQRVQAAAGFHAAANGSADFLAGFAGVANGIVIVEGDALAFLEFQKVVNVGDDGGLLWRGRKRPRRG